MAVAAGALPDAVEAAAAAGRLAGALPEQARGRLLSTAQDIEG